MIGATQLDIDAYIDALPSLRLREPRYAPPLYTEPRWPLLKPYNAFCGIERRRGGQLAGWLLAAGCIAKPKHCDICGSADKVGLHGESYYHVGRYPALCRRCHFALHLRTRQWDAWQRIVDAAAATGREWFVLAPRHGIDLSQHLRDRFGWQAANIERSPISPLPRVIEDLLPSNMLPHPCL